MALPAAAAGAVAARQVWTRRRFLTTTGLLLGAGMTAGTGVTALGGTITTTLQPSLAAGQPTALALAEIPAAYLALFQRTGTTAVPWNMLAAVAWQESRFNPDAVSPVGAAGMMQIMPGTATTLGITLADRFDPDIAVPAAHRYLTEQKTAFGTDELMLAAYNAGPGNVQTHGGIPPFTETRTYVANVMAKAPAYATTMQLVDGAGSATVGQVLALNGSLSDGARLEIYPRGIQDLPNMDSRVLGLLVAIAQRYGGTYVSSLKTGHSQYINGSCASAGGCRESRHWTYHAMDLWKIGGQIVQGGSPIPHDCWVWLKHLTADHGRPSTCGSPWGRDDTGGGDTTGHFTDADHQDHFHLDYR